MAALWSIGRSRAQRHSTVTSTDSYTLVDTCKHAFAIGNALGYPVAWRQWGREVTYRFGN